MAVAAGTSVLDVPFGGGYIFTSVLQLKEFLMECKQ